MHTYTALIAAVLIGYPFWLGAYELKLKTPASGARVGDVREICALASATSRVEYLDVTLGDAPAAARMRTDSFLACADEASHGDDDSGADLPALVEGYGLVNPQAGVDIGWRRPRLGPRFFIAVGGENLLDDSWLTSAPFQRWRQQPTVARQAQLSARVR